MAKNWLGSAVGRVVKTITIPADYASYVTENGRKVVKSGSLYTDATLGSGLIVNDADITDGKRCVSLMVRGSYINNNLPTTLTDQQKTALAAQGLFAVKYPSDLHLVVEPIVGTENVLGKLVSALQSDIEVNQSGITGISKYVTGYTGFSGDVSEQSGNYIALKATADDGATITVQVIGGGKPAVTLDDDGEVVLRIRSKNYSARFVATKDDKIMTVEYPFNTLTLNPQA